MTKSEAITAAKQSSMLSSKIGYYVFYNAGNMSPDWRNRYEIRPSWMIPSEIDGSIKNCSAYCVGNQAFEIVEGHITKNKIE